MGPACYNNYTVAYTNVEVTPIEIINGALIHPWELRHMHGWAHIMDNSIITQCNIPTNLP